MLLKTTDDSKVNDKGGLKAAVLGIADPFAEKTGEDACFPARPLFISTAEN